jgi:hypothetical protein
MGQKANILTLKPYFRNLNLQSKNSKYFLQGYFFIELFKKLLLRKSILLLNIISNFCGNIFFIHLKLFIKTAKLFSYKKFSFYKKSRNLQINDLLLHNVFSKRLFKTLSFLKINFIVFSIKILNKDLKLKKNKTLLKFFFLKSKPFLNILFQRRYTFFFDLVKQIVLFIQDLIPINTFLETLSQLFKYLHKRIHTRFFVFFNSITNLIINFNRYKTIRFTSKIKGLKLRIKGKLQGKMRASLKYLQEGKIPAQSFSKPVYTAKQTISNLYGAYGLTL